MTNGVHLHSRGSSRVLEAWAKAQKLDRLHVRNTFHHQSSNHVSRSMSVAPWPVASGSSDQGFPRQAYFRLQEVLLTQGSSDSHPASPALAGGCTSTSPTWKPLISLQSCPVNRLAHQFTHLCVPSQSSEGACPGGFSTSWMRRSNPLTLSLFSFSFEGSFILHQQTSQANLSSSYRA